VDDPQPRGRDDPAWGPEVERRGRRRRWGRWFLSVLVVLLVVAVALPLAAFWQLPRIPVDHLATATTPVHVLVAGSDSREGLSPEEQRELSTGRADVLEGERTDTIFVMSVRGGEVALLAFPRDLWVRRCDGSTGRINVAQAIEGPGCLVRTVRDLSGIDIQHYVRVTFGGFRDVVDAVGGVELCLDEAINDRDAGIDLPAGCQRLDGADALGFVRVRKIDDDLQRIQRQQQFLQALASEVATPATLLNPLRFWRLSQDAGHAVTFDDSLGVLAALRLARGVGGLSAGDLRAHTVPSDPRTTAGGAAVLEIRTGEAETLFARFRDGSVLDDVDALPSRSQVAVQIHNGAGVSGLAARIRARLGTLGYEQVDIGNTEARERTVLLHPPDAREVARRLVVDLAEPIDLEASTEVEDPTLLLGRDAADFA